MCLEINNNYIIILSIQSNNINIVNDSTNQGNNLNNYKINLNEKEFQDLNYIFENS
jgi:hypothetical protein